MQHFFLSPESFTSSADKIIIDDPDVLHQMNRVLRMQKGDQFIALDNTGFEYVCALQNIDRTVAKALIIEKLKNIAEADIQITLYQALPKKMELFEWVLQKGTEIGISEFVPLVTERTQRHEITKLERLEKILKEAAEQSERGKIPKLANQQNFEDAMTTAKQKAEHVFLFHGRGDHPLFTTLLNKEHANNICLFIGPEGGFSEKEIEHAQKNAVYIASLGKRVLRTETAGIVATVIALT